MSNIHKKIDMLGRLAADSLLILLLLGIIAIPSASSTLFKYRNSQVLSTSDHQEQGDDINSVNKNMDVRETTQSTRSEEEHILPQ